MIIREIDNRDIEEISHLHKKIFGNTHFSSTFTISLLRRYFKELLDYNAYKLVVVKNNEIQGYLIAGFNPDIPVNKFKKNNLIRLFFILLMNPKFLIEKIREFLSFDKSKIDSIHKVNVSIYLIAVNTGNQNSGIGKFILNHFEEILQKQEIKQYTLAVRSDNIQAINFYKKNMFKEVGRDRKAVTFLKTIQ